MREMSPNKKTMEIFSEQVNVEFKRMMSPHQNECESGDTEDSLEGNKN